MRFMYRRDCFRLFFWKSVRAELWSARAIFGYERTKARPKTREHATVFVTGIPESNTGQMLLEVTVLRVLPIGVITQGNIRLEAFLPCKSGKKNRAPCVFLREPQEKQVLRLRAPRTKLRMTILGDGPDDKIELETQRLLF